MTLEKEDIVMTMYLTFTYNVIDQTLKESKETYIVFVDLQKSFDCIYIDLYFA